MDGVASTGPSTAALLSHGDHGLGTFGGINGEMIVIDGRMFRMKDDAAVTAMDAATSTEIHPFAQVTRFRPQAATRAPLPTKAALAGVLTRLLPGSGRNQFVAVRVHGTFASLTVRTGNGQRAPREGLAAVAARQVVHALRRVTGTLVGFRSPAYSQGISVAGDHLHFITDDRTRGGHVLALEAEEPVDIAAAVLPVLRLEVPQGDDEFDEATLQTQHEGLQAAEG